MKPPTVPDSAWVRFREPPFLAVFSGYILLYALLVSKGVHVRGDDFAYLESVTGSLARGSLYTHDFIGPRNAFLTAIGAAVYSLTGNFYLSTFGALPFFACANFLLLYAIFRHRLPPWQAAAWTAFTATFPFYLHKSLDYHGTLPTLTCFLTALLAFRSGRHALFFLAAGLAVSTRQNSLVLFTLPLFALAEGFRKGGPIDRRPLYYLVATLAALGALHLYMNVNWFNRNLHVLPSDPVFAIRIARQFGVGLFLGLFFLSLANLALGRQSPMAMLRENLRRYALPAGASVLVRADRLRLARGPGLVPDPLDRLLRSWGAPSDPVGRMRAHLAVVPGPAPVAVERLYCSRNRIRGHFLPFGILLGLLHVGARLARGMDRSDGPLGSARTG